ncbi:MAG: DUF1521 domain-containing protein [Rudaea sp.]|uniref:DUF1521 domain-containing protein n=1 Tax=unclassified Rudaea TaxID=2627037 RepID=UPI0010F63136|nr:MULTISPECIES: DUF1521 domain-containing protein [unclassified Rudaea]MBN8887463.1 DUF1521 domain-containing protein [Rudaea sp.]MBR0344261.1 DUF1521 domain-containing protein [Rudaea sp.]
MSTVSSMLGNVTLQSHADSALAQTDFGSGGAGVRAESFSAAHSQLASGEKAVLATFAGVFAANGLASMVEGYATAGLLSAFANPAGSNHFSSPAFNAATSLATVFGGLLGGMAQRAADVIGGAITQDAATGLLESCRDDRQGIRGFVDQLFGGQNESHIDQVENALQRTDLSQLSSGQRATFLMMAGHAAADGYVSRAEANAMVDFLDRASGATGKQWTVNQSGNQAHIDLGRYTLDLNKSDSSFVLTNKATGQATRIWGDPHFDVNGQQIGTFKGPMTLNLDDGTKITVYPKASADHNGTAYTDQLVITRGDRALDVTGLDQQTNDHLNILQSPVGGRLVDLLAPDGAELYENSAGQGASTWFELQGLSLQSISSDALASI